MRTDLHGYEIVPLKENTTRECVRFASRGRINAILQKNGKVAVSGFKLRYGNFVFHEQLRVTRALHALRLVGPDVLAKIETEDVERRRKMDVESLKLDAERLGFAVKPLKPAKKVPKALTPSTAKR